MQYPQKKDVSRTHQCNWSRMCTNSSTIVSPLLHHILMAERKQKTPQISHFQPNIRTCVENSSNEKGRFQNTPVELVRNVPRFVHYSVAFSSPYIPDKKRTKNTLNMTFSVYFPYLCAEVVQQRFAYSYANCTESYALCGRNVVSMTH